MRGKLIGLVGYAGSGKTTLANEAVKYITNHLHAPKIVARNFSRPITDMLMTMGIPREMIEDKSRWNEPLDILCGHSIRYAATTLGTEWGRDQIGQDVWTRIAMKQANTLREEGCHVIIDNVRFPSEMEAMKQEGAIFIAIYRDGLKPDMSHKSEQFIAGLRICCEYGFKNNEPIDDATKRFTIAISNLI